MIEYRQTLVAYSGKYIWIREYREIGIWSSPIYRVNQEWGKRRTGVNDMEGWVYIHWRVEER